METETTVGWVIERVYPRGDSIVMTGEFSSQEEARQRLEWFRKSKSQLGAGESFELVRVTTTTTREVVR